MSRLKFRERRNVGGGGGKRSSESRFARMGRGGEDELIQPDGEVFEREGVDGSRRSITRVVHVRLIRWLDIGNR